MQLWLVSVVAVASFTLLILFLLSFDTLEYQEIGLNYSWISETVQKDPYQSGRYYLGLGNHFIKFPKMVKMVKFVDEYSPTTQGPALTSRTRDGLNVRLEIAFQYKLKFDEIYDLYSTLGTEYEKTLVRMAIEQLTTAATQHNAHFFFSNRTFISKEMHKMLDNHFKTHGFSAVPFFQLRTVHLPSEFEDAIEDTQVKQQDIEIASLQQATNKVTFQTKVLQAEQKVKVMKNQAEGEAQSILAQNDAYCEQFKITQSLQSSALKDLQEAAGWSPSQLLEYLRIRAMRDHPSNKTTIRL